MLNSLILYEFSTFCEHSNKTVRLHSKRTRNTRFYTEYFTKVKKLPIWIENIRIMNDLKTKKLA